MPIPLSALIVFAVMLAGCSAYSPAGPPRDSAARTPRPPAPSADSVLEATWARDPRWDDGLAEVALYDARRPQYGKIVSYQALFIVVKEDFTRRHHVKADPPLDGKQTYPVLKLNAVHAYWTERYPYNFLASVFVHRDNPAALVKLTVGSQEWCGNTFKEITTWGATPVLVSNSYFDGQGDRSEPLDLRAGDLVEDQLPLALRGLPFRPGTKLERRLLPSIISNNTRKPLAFVAARIEVAGEEVVLSGSGRISAWKVTVSWAETEQSWWLDRTAPHTPVKMESSDGRSWLLRSRTRKAYWSEPTYRPKM